MERVDFWFLAKLLFQRYCLLQFLQVTLQVTLLRQQTETWKHRNADMCRQLVQPVMLNCPTYSEDIE